MKTAIVFGSSGLVGKKLIHQLVLSADYDKIKVINRSTQAYESTKIEEIIDSLENLDLIKSKLSGDDLFICLGSTIKKAGSKTKFSAIDLELPVRIATLAKTNGISCLVAISSLGANFKSSNFYLMTKGLMEKELVEIGVKHTYFVRPSMLLGKRSEFRLGELIGKIVIQFVGLFFFGKFKKYKGIYDWQVAKSMIYIAKAKPKKQFWESDELYKIITDGDA